MPGGNSPLPPVAGPYRRWQRARVDGMFYAFRRAFVVYNCITGQLEFAQFWVIHLVDRIENPAVGFIAEQYAGTPVLSKLATRGASLI